MSVLDKVKAYKIELLLILIFLSDFVTKLITTYSINFFSRFGGVSKLFFLFYMLFFIIKNKIKEKLILKLLIILTITFCVGNIETLSSMRLNNTLFSSLYYFIEYSLLFIIVWFFSAFEEKKVNSIFNVFLVVGVVNAIFMLIGMFFDIELFRSYPFSERFGFNGILAQTSEVSYFYIVLTLVLYYDFCLNRRNPFLLLFFIGTSILIGTKVVWLYLVALTSFHLLKKIKNKFILRCLVIIILPLILIFNNSIIYFLIQNLYHGAEIYSDCGILCLFTSHRTELLIEFINYISTNWGLKNYIFGGIDFNLYRVEFGLVDLYMFFGVLGILVYGLLIKKYFIGNNIFQTYFVLIILLLSFLAGNFLTSFIVSILFYTGILKLRNIKKDFLNETNHTRP